MDKIDKLPLYVKSSDWHIDQNNTEQIIGLVKQKIELAKRLQTTILICLGDIFQSRQAQPLIVLKCFEEILDLVDEAGMTIMCISGNHCKTNYSSSDSFLDPFKHHPALKTIKTYEGYPISNDIKLWFLPFFEENMWVDYLHKYILEPVKEQKKYKHILLSHQELTGSTNNDSFKMSNSIKSSLFKDFYKVFLGHFHNQQQIGDNIYHIPSIQANNFGEDNEKGFTVFYSDGSHELVKSKFSEYHTLKIDLDDTTKQALIKIKKDAAELIKDTGANVRFKFEGSQDKVQTVKSEEFTVLGIDVKKEHKVVVRSIEKAKEGKVISYSKESIKEKFNTFCEIEEYDDLEYGLKCLNKKLESDG